MDFDGIQDFIDTMDIDDIELTKAEESAILLTALESVCTDDEFGVIMENLTELELYGLIESAEIATEAKKIVYKQTKEMNLNREQAKACILLAKKKRHPAWIKYHKGRLMMFEGRDECYRVFGNKGKNIAKQIVNNTKKKSSTMGKTVTGNLINNKIDIIARRNNKGA